MEAGRCGPGQPRVRHVARFRLHAQRFGSNTEALSPVHQLDAKMPPALVFHGDGDTTVTKPANPSRCMTSSLRAATCASFVNVPTGTHGFQTQLPEWKDKSRVIMKDFLTRQHLAAGCDQVNCHDCP